MMVEQPLAYADLSDQGWLRLTGRDRLDFMQRLSTNDFRALAAPAGLPAVLANPVGRVIALVMAYAKPDALLLRAMPGQAAALMRYFSSMIFWQDEVQASDLSAETAQIGLFGPGWPEQLAQLGVEVGETAEHETRSGEIAGTPVLVCRGGPLETPDWTLVTPRAAAPAVNRALGDVATRLDRNAMELARIEKGIPAWGKELSDEVTPLETGLLPAISFSKGCYTGQEVIARQTNYDKVTRRLVGLRVEAGAPADLSGAAIPGPGRGGFVTSSAFSPRFDRTIALAIVPRDLATPGARVEVEHDGQTYAAEVAALPFA